LPYIRLLIVQDKQTNGEQFAATDLLASGTGEPMINCFQSLLHLGKFKIWRDIFFKMPITNTVSAVSNALTRTGGTDKYLKVTLKFRKPIVVRFGGNIADVTSIVDNSFHVMAACSDDTLVPIIAYKARSYFHDV